MAETKLPEAGPPDGQVSESIPEGQETRPDVHIKGVGSFVTLDFKKGTAHKAYRPRRAVKLLYWLAFQAPFPYSTDRDALEACRERRVIVGLLTKFWFGLDIVAPVVEIAEEDNGEVAFVTQLVEGQAPENKFRARSFLKLLTHHFIEAGLPTWQVSPHNPRSVGNLMEVDDGTYRIIDLESNLVAALTPMSAVSGAIQQKQFPNFDDIDTKTLEGYLARHGSRIRAALGSDDYLKLMDSALAYAEYTSRWHGREPRVLGRIIKLVFWPFDRAGRIVRFFKRAGAGSQLRAEIFIRRGINHWVNVGWISQEEAQDLRSSLQQPEVSAALAHLGTQMALALVLFFPFGSISRFLWPIVNRIRVELRGLFTRQDIQPQRDVHTPTLTMAVLGLLPKIGGGSYLFSKPLRSNRMLFVVAFDRILRRFPFKLYGRLKLERRILRMAKPQTKENKAAASA